jgi:GTP-binding protein
VTQVASAPPRFRFFANVEREIPAHYIRFLESRFRTALGLVGTPLRLEFRRTGRTFVEAGRTRAPDSRGRAKRR